jgi:hypothetical protein
MSGVRRFCIPLSHHLVVVHKWTEELATMTWYPRKCCSGQIQNIQRKFIMIRDRSLDPSHFDPFPPLPVELVRCILEVAALKDKSTSLTLARVSKLVYHWAIPIIYHTVILRGVDQMYPFYCTLQARSTGIGEKVRRLYIHRGIGYSRPLAEVIGSCPHLECLVGNLDMADAAFVDGMGTSCPGPWHIMLLCPDSKIVPLAHPLLRNITHIYIDALHDDLVDGIQALPRLTHLGFGCWGDAEPQPYPTWITCILSSPSLIILLLHAFEDDQPTDLYGDKWCELSKIGDERLLAGPALHEDDYISLVKSGVTIWDDAESKYKDWRTLVEE